MKTYDDEDSETKEIVSKLRKGKGDQADERSEGSASEEGELAAAEDLFQAIRGRAPSSEEAEAVRAALGAYQQACGGK